MTHAYTRKLVATLAVFLAVAMFFSGCSLFEKQIEIPEGHFFEEVEDGMDSLPQDSTPTDATLTEEPATEPIIMYVEVDYDILNIRSEPSSRSDLVGQLADGEVVAVLEVTENWLRIENGWIYRSYTKEYHEETP